jgi:hypothetical protein
MKLASGTPTGGLAATAWLDHEAATYERPALGEQGLDVLGALLLRLAKPLAEP